MSPIIYEPDDNLHFLNMQKELKDYYGEDLAEGTIIHHKGIYYKLITNHTYWRSPVFVEMSVLDVWWNRKRGRID